VEQYEQAERAFERSLQIREEFYGPEHPEVAGTLTSLARFYGDQGRYDEAEQLLQRALAIHEQLDDGRHPGVALDLAHLGALYVVQGSYAEARPFYERALTTVRQSPLVAIEMNRLALDARSAGRDEQVEEIYEWALDVATGAVGVEDASTTFLRMQYAQFLESVGRTDEAAQLSGG
jgi:tetratricopeptide (TPR) repeat protein